MFIARRCLQADKVDLKGAIVAQSWLINLSFVSRHHRNSVRLAPDDERDLMRV